MKTLEPAASLFVLAHPDDELLFSHAIQDQAALPDSKALVLVATNGEASSVDLRGDNFVYSGGRKEEVQQSLAALGVPLDRQHYRGLTDSLLEWEVSTLAGTIARLMLQHDVSTIYTFDKDGYDNHTDHISTYRAAMLLSGRLSVQHLVRTRDAAEADVTVSGSEESKLAVIRHHISQFDSTDDNLITYIAKEYSGGLADEYYRQAA